MKSVQNEDYCENARHKLREKSTTYRYCDGVNSVSCEELVKPFSALLHFFRPNKTQNNIRKRKERHHTFSSIKL
jgi:hypothetical protein